MPVQCLVQSTPWLLLPFLSETVLLRVAEIMGWLSPVSLENVRQLSPTYMQFALKNQLQMKHR